MPGWRIATHAVGKANPKAWRILLEGDVCDPKTLGPTVTFMGRTRVAWYSIDGGPLNGLIVRVFEEGPPCTLQLATSEYAAAERWKVPRSE